MQQSAPMTPVDPAFVQALDDYLTAYLDNRNLAAIDALLADDFVGFGTGPGEHAFNRATALAGYQQDITDAPEPVKANIHERHLRQVSPDCAVAGLLLDMQAYIQGQYVKFNQLRLTLTFCRQYRQVKMASMHISFPTDLHGANEAFPLKELEARAQVLNRMVQDETKTLREAYHELEQVVTTDSVSGLASRAHFERVLANEHERFEQFGRGYALVLIDLDYFKEVNDRFGHLAGDMVLKVVGGIIHDRLRAVDRACRWGGDEFLVLLPQTSQEQAADWAQSLLNTVATPEVAEQLHHTGMSMGVGYIKPGECPEKLFSRVDQALYSAKDRGRGVIVHSD